MKDEYNTAALWLLVVLAQACGNWPIRRGWVFRRRALKRQKLNKRKSFLSIKIK